MQLPAQRGGVRQVSECVVLHRALFRDQPVRRAQGPGRRVAGGNEDISRGRERQGEPLGAPGTGFLNNLNTGKKKEGANLSPRRLAGEDVGNPSSGDQPSAQVSFA